MATAVLQQNVLITLPMRDVNLLAELVKKFRWAAKTLQAPATSKQMSDDELYCLAEEIKSSMNKDAPKISMAEIVKEVRDYRNGK